MSANLALTNQYYNVYCNEVFERQNAMCIIGNIPNNQLVSPGTDQLVTLSGGGSSIFQGVTLNSSNNVLTLSSLGVYLIDFAITTDAPAATGGQGKVFLLINGSTPPGGFDIAYSPLTGQQDSGNVKLTIKGFVEQINNTPTTISFNLSTLVTPANFRYAQLSVQKVASIL